MKQYTAYRPTDARGYDTFLTAEFDPYGEIRYAVLDAVNDENEYKTTSATYNEAMHEESGTYYRTAVRRLEQQIIQNKDQLDVVSGATVLSQDAQTLLDEVKSQFRQEQLVNQAQQQANDHLDQVTHKVLDYLAQEQVEVSDFVAHLYKTASAQTKSQPAPTLYAIK